MPGGAWHSPFQYSTVDYQAKQVIVEVAFDEPTLVINGAGLTGYRQAGCVYDRVVIGAIENGTRRVWLIPEGPFAVMPSVLESQGFTLITDITNSGFTLGTTEEPT